MRGHLNIRETNETQAWLEREAKAFARTKANSNTPWDKPVRPVTYGEVLDRQNRRTHRTDGTPIRKEAA